MQTLSLEFPEEVFSALRRSPEEFAQELRLAAAIFWYSRGEVSQEKAAQIAVWTGRTSCWPWRSATWTSSRWTSRALKRN